MNGLAIIFATIVVRHFYERATEYFFVDNRVNTRDGYDFRPELGIGGVLKANLATFLYDTKWV